MQKLWKSFSTFAMSETESSKERKGHKQISGDENKILNGLDDQSNVGKKEELWRANQKSTNSWLLQMWDNF